MTGKTFNNTGGLWLAENPRANPRWRGSITINGKRYKLEGRGQDQRETNAHNAPTIGIKVVPYD